MNKENYLKQLSFLSIDALRALVEDTRIQVNVGLMSNKEAHDRINVLTIAILTKEIEASEANGL